MAKYGARYIRWAPFAESNPEPENAYPNYGTAISLSKLVKVTDSPNIAEAKHFADDELDEYASEVTDADVELDVSDISNNMAHAVYGAEITQDGDVEYGEDAAPYGGLGFVSCKMVNNVRKYVGIVYPKVKAVLQGEEFETKGDSINFKDGKMKFKASKPNAGKWKRVSAEKNTPELAKSWVDAKLAPPTVSGTT